MAIGIGLGLIASALIGGGASIYGATKAASAQKKAANRAGKAFAPYTEVGEGAISSLAQLYGLPSSGRKGGVPFGPEALAAFRDSPDYQFAFDEGSRAVEFSNAAKGQLQSGNNLRDLVGFGQGLATQNFGNYVNRLLALAGIGANAAGGKANAAYQGGAAQASGIVGGANALSSTLSNATNNLAFYNALNNPAQSAYGGSGFPYGAAGAATGGGYIL